MDGLKSPQFAAALIINRDARRAWDEASGAVADSLGGPPDLAMVFASHDHAAEMTRIAEGVQGRLAPRALLGCAAEAIVGGSREIEDEPALSLWAARLPGVELTPMRLHFERKADGSVIEGWPEELLRTWPSGALMILLGEPFTFPADLLLAQLNEDHPETRVVGGMAGGGGAPGENRLVEGGDALAEGAVAVLLSGALRLRTLVSQGCRPIGEPFVVTQAERNVIGQLGGRPALLQLKRVFDRLPNQEKELVQRGLHLGRVVNEYQDRFEQGDFLVRNVQGIDPDDGSIAVGDFIRVGQTVQFHIHDAETADIELRQLLEKAKGGPVGPPGAALLFTCNGRGTRLFGQPHHDARAVRQAFGDIPLAGFFAQGEMGPVGGRNFMHGFTASLAMFG